MLSKASRYGVRSVIYLAQHSNSNFLLGVKELANKIHINEPMLSKILYNLTKKKFIKSKKGRKGGFYMTPAQKARKLIYVIKELEQSNKLINECMLGQDLCKTHHQCPYSSRIAAMRSELQAIYGTDTIEETAIKLNKKH